MGIILFQLLPLGSSFNKKLGLVEAKKEAQRPQGIGKNNLFDVQCRVK